MRLSVFYEHIFEAAQQSGITVEGALKHAKSCGIDLLECDLWRLDDREEVKKLLDLQGMGVSCIYAHFDFLHDIEDSERRYHDLLGTAEYFGAEKVLCIPGFFDEGREKEEQMKLFCEGISRMCDAAKSYGVTVTVEDFDDIKSPCCRMADIRYLLDNCEGLGYTFDTGNFRYCLEDAGQAYSLLSDRIAHVHLKDRSYDIARSDADGTNGKADLSGAVMYPVEVCGGVIGTEGLIRKLISDGYDGVLAIEHFGAVDQLMYMKKSAENILRITEGI